MEKIDRLVESLTWGVWGITRELMENKYENQIWVANLQMQMQMLFPPLSFPLHPYPCPFLTYAA